MSKMGRYFVRLYERAMKFLTFNLALVAQRSRDNDSRIRRIFDTIKRARKSTSVNCFGQVWE
jgi:hypothetical protein